MLVVILSPDEMLLVSNASTVITASGGVYFLYSTKVNFHYWKPTRTFILQVYTGWHRSTPTIPGMYYWALFFVAYEVTLVEKSNRSAIVLRWNLNVYDNSILLKGGNA